MSVYNDDFDNYEWLTLSDINLVGLGSMSFTAFVKVGVHRSDYTYIMASGHGNFFASWAVGMGDGSDEQVYFQLNTGGLDVLLSSVGSFLENIWYHVACTYDGSNMRIYIDGVQDGILGKTGNISAGGATNTRIFQHGFMLNRQLDEGEAYDLRIYNRALSVGEIRAIMLTKGADGICHGLLHRWPMNERPAGTLVDAGGVKDIISGYNASPNNFPSWESEFVRSKRYF